MDDSLVKDAVRKQYGKIAEQGGIKGACCGPGSGVSCCPSSATSSQAEEMAKRIGYTSEELGSLPDDANLGLGCGNPNAIAKLNPGEVVIDLGSGAGIDCFLAARKVGDAGKVIGVDMTPEMLNRARANAQKANINNVEFRLGEIEHLPIADSTADVVISNCVINISTDKLAVYREAFRVLKLGGRLAIADIIASAPLPEEVRNSVALHVGCLAGAATSEELERTLKQAGFSKVLIQLQESNRLSIRDWLPDSDYDQYVVPATIEAFKS